VKNKQILYPPGAYVSVEETKNLNKEISIYMIGLVVRSEKKEKQGQWSIGIYIGIAQYEDER